MKNQIEPMRYSHLARIKNGTIRLAHRVALCAVLVGGAKSYAAGTDTWVGNTDANWSTPANWTTVGGSTPPANGDSLVFGAAGTSGLTLNNNISGLTLNKLTFNSGASSFTFGGNTFTNGTGGIDASALTGGTMTFTPTIVIGNGFQRWNVGAGATLAFGSLGAGADSADLYTPNGAIVIIRNAGTITTTTADGWGWRSGAVAGTGHLGAGVVLDNGNNTYDWASVGTQTAGTSHAIVAPTYTTAANADAHNVKTTGNTTIAMASHSWVSILVSGATLTLNNNSLFIDNGIILQGGGIFAGSTALKSNGDGLYIYVPDTGAISSSIQNNGANAKKLYKAGTGTLSLTGGNSYTAGTVVYEGTLSVGNAGALGSGALTLGGGNLDCSSANLILNNNIAQNWNADFTFVGSQNLNLGAGAVTLGATRQVTVSANTLTVGGAIGDASHGYGLTKAGNGTLKLNGANTYTGTTAVNGGVLLVANTTQGNGSVTVADGAAAGVVATANTTYWTPSSLTVGSSTGGSLQFSVFGTTLPAIAPSSLTLNGTTTINISSAPFVNNVSYPLFSGYTSGALVLGSQPSGVLGHLVISGGTVSYAVTNLAVTTWTAAVSTNWDTTTANWTNSVGGNLFAANNPVLLSDSASGAGPLLVNITPSAVAPSSITVNNTTKSYIIGGLAISGSTGLAKTGNNTLTLTGTNTFTGDIAISGGTIEIGGAGQLGSGNYLANIQDDATLKVNTTAAQTLSGTISGSGALSQAGAGVLTLSGANTYSAGTTNAGPITLGSSSVGAGNSVTNGPLGTGPVTLNGGTVQMNAKIFGNNLIAAAGTTNVIDNSVGNSTISGSLSGAGTVTLQNSSLVGLSVYGGDALQDWSGFTGTLNYVTTSRALNFNPGGSVLDLSHAAFYLSGTLNYSTLGLGQPAKFGSLSGPGGYINNSVSLEIGNLNASTTSGATIQGAGTVTKVGTGVQTLTGGSTYSGLTTVQNGSLVAGSTGAFGANSSTIALGDATTISSNLSPSLLIDGAYSLAHNVTVGYDTTPTTGIYTIGGNTASSATLNGSISLNQNLVVTQAVGGTFAISGGISGGSVSLTKVGAGTVNLAGGYSHSGPIVVNAGTLGLDAAQSSSSSSTLTVNNAALALTLNNGNSSITPANVTFLGNAALSLDYGTATSPSAAAINANGFTVTSSGTTTVNITGPNLVIGQYPLIYTGGSMPTNNFVLGAMPLGVAGVLTNSGTSLDLLITGTGQSLTWYGADSLGNPLTTWNINTSSNWNSGNAHYVQYSGNSYGDYVTFDDTLYTPSGAEITLNTAVVPSSVNFNNNSTAYSITGSGGIGGATSLVKSGSGSLYLGTSNSYTGGTIVNGGILTVAKDSALGASNGPVTLNNGVTLQYSNTTASVRGITMTANSTLDVAPSANAQLAGVVSGSASLTKTGNGTLTLSGTNTYTGKTIVDGGALSVTGGLVSSPTASGPGLIVANTQNASLNVSGGTVAGNTSDGQYSSGLVVGNASGIAGSVTVSGSGNVISDRQIALGNASGSYGAWNQTGGTGGTGTNTGGFLVVGFGGASGVFNQSGGTFTVGYNAATIAAGNSGSLGVMNLSGGTFNSMATAGGSSTAGGLAVGEFGTGVLNVSGTATVNLSGNFNLFLGKVSGANGTVNLLGGTLTTTKVSPGPGTSAFNFNGGTLQAGAASTTFMGGLTSAHVYSGGAVINSSSNAITISQALLAPTDYGVSSISLSSGGSGFIAPPVVTISGGTGSGATAIAQVSGGAVTVVVVTSPGTGYQSGDVLSVNFTGGGGSGVTANTPALALNTSGGLTKTGNGTLTLSGANTYAGNTTIKGGTLELAQSFATLAPNSTVSITNGAFLQLTAGTVTNVVAGLVTNGVAAGNGLYSSANSSGYITGSGYLKVGTSAPTVEPIITSYNANTGQLTLTWAQSGWRLECQTNNLTTGLSPTGWTDVSGASSPYIITVNPTAPTVFYRLVNP